jgi:hypothetical protein
MIEAIVLAAVVVHAAAATPAPPTVNPAVVDAVGDAQVILTVPRAGMVRVVVDSEVGTACTLVDHQRGPFVSDGVVGKSSCAVDVLLDAGLYKVRLTSPADPTPKTSKKAKSSERPRARVRAIAFSDVDDVRLLPRGRSATAVVPPGRQVSHLIRVERRREVVLDVAGRSVGDVRLWRDGAFVEDVAFTSTVLRPAPGRPMWHHHLETVLDAGDYVLVAAGTQAQAFTTGQDDDTVIVAHDARPLPDGGAVALTLPAWGFSSLRAPAGALAVMLTASPGAEVKVESTAVVRDAELGERRRGCGRGCTVSATGLQRGCSFVTGDDDHLGTVFSISGPAGAAVKLLAVPSGPRVDGRGFGPAHAAVGVKLASPSPLLSVVGFPPSLDDAPLSCALERLDDDGRVLGTVAVDAPSLGWTQAWKRRFNVDGTATAVWLELEKPGLYSIDTDKAVNASCDVYSLAGGERTRIGGADAPCATRLTLPKGPVEIRLTGGIAGVQTLRVGASGVAALVGDDRLAPPRTGCVFATGQRLAQPLSPGRYRVRTSSGRSDAFLGVMTATPGLSAPVVVAVDPGRPVSLPLDAGTGFAASAALMDDASRLRCDVDGVAVPGCLRAPGDAAGRATFGIADDAGPLLVTLRRPPTPTTEPALVGAVPTPAPLPVVTAGTPKPFDLDGGAARSFLVDVQRPGIYRIETTGLLATACAVRTATSASLFSGEKNGRGRNCRVEAFLKPGRFRVDVRAIGQSRGRASLQLVPLPSVDGGPLVVGDERYFAVPASTPATHRLESRGGPLDVTVEARDATLSCRLDDDDGWPLLPPPHACRLQEQVPAGRHVLTVFPLSVESRRMARASTATTAKVLRGDGTHALALNVPAQAVLGADGKDRFRFTLTADVEVGIVLGNAMQGRLRQEREGQPGDVVGIVPPVGGAAWGLGGDDDGESYEGDGESYEGDGESYEGDGESYEGEREGGDGGESRGLSTAAMASATVHQPVAPLGGHVVALSAGTWLLETEHSRGDVGITYNVGVFVRDLVPGATLQAQAPAIVDVIAPDASGPGLVRLKTRGPTDTACRLVDERGDPVLSSTASGEDWNCAMALPLAAGSRHRLFVDAEILRPGPTQIEATFLPAKSTGPLKDGDRFRVVGKVALAEVVPAEGAVVDIELGASEGRFSCAAFDADGAVLAQQLDVTRCPLLLWGAGDPRPFSVMVWTADRPASVVASVKSRAVRRGGLFAGAAGDDVVVAVEVPRRGRFAVAPTAWSVVEGRRGALLPSDGALALDPAVDGGSVLLAAPRGERIDGAATEHIVALDDAGDIERVRRLRGRSSERQRSGDQAIHVVDLRVRPGSSAQPGCALDGGASVALPDRCVAASATTRESVLSFWTRPGGDTAVDVLRRAIVLPARAEPVRARAGRGTARLAMPASAFRAEVAAVDDAWVLLVDDGGRTVDLCAPAREPKGALLRCVLRGRGGSVVVAPAGDVEHEVKVDVVAFDGASEPPRTFAGSREVVARAAGQERLVFAAAREARRLVVEGRAALGCGLALDDGRRLEGCDVVVPAGVAGTVTVEHARGPWRALLERPWWIPALRIGPTGDGAALPAGQAARLTGNSLIRRVVLDVDSVLRLRADDGTCAVLTTGDAPRTLAATGDDDGCDLQLPLARGTYRVAVRGFAGGTLDGSTSWTTSPLVTLGEGRGDEVLALPGEARFFLLPLEGDGEVGLGVQVDGDVLDCALLDGDGAVVAEGCQVFTRLKKGRYTWRLTVEGERPRRFRPVVFGLKGAEVDVPESWLRDFFARVPRPAPAASSSASEVR